MPKTLFAITKTVLFLSYLWVGQLGALQRGGVAPEPVLVNVQLLQVFLPLGDLAHDGLPGPRVSHHGHLELRHLPHLHILGETKGKIKISTVARRSIDEMTVEGCIGRARTFIKIKMKSTYLS